MPVADGEFLPEHPQSALAKGCASDVNIMVGTTHQETHLFRGLIPVGAFARMIAVHVVAVFCGPQMLGAAKTWSESRKLASEIFDLHVKQHFSGKSLSLFDWDSVMHMIIYHRDLPISYQRHSTQDQTANQASASRSRVFCIQPFNPFAKACASLCRRRF